MDGYTKNKLDKMATIERVTLDLLGKFPIKQIAVTDIARVAGVSKVTIFNYYESKNKLIKKVIFDHFHNIYDKYVEIVESDLAFGAAYQTLTSFKLKQVRQNTAIFNQNVMTLYASDDSFYDQKAQEKSDDLLLRLIKKGRTDGSINPNYSDETILNLFHIYSEGMKIFSQSPETLFLMSDDLTNIFLNGLK